MNAIGFIMALILVLVPVPAICQTPQDNPFTSGNNFLRMCDSEAIIRAVCTAYVAGMSDAIVASKNPQICFPDGVDTGQLF